LACSKNQLPYLSFGFGVCQQLGNLSVGFLLGSGDANENGNGGFRADVIEICREQISGMADESDRPGLQRAEELARAGTVRKILVHEVSRLARRNSVAHGFVEMLEDLGVSLYCHTQGIETCLPNGKRNATSQIVVPPKPELPLRNSSACIYGSS
jgi:hypothetical protein